MAYVTRPNCDNCELLRGDEVVNVLAMAARGELPVCHECERLATLPTRDTRSIRGVSLRWRGFSTATRARRRSGTRIVSSARCWLRWR